MSRQRETAADDKRCIPHIGSRRRRLRGGVVGDLDWGFIFFILWLRYFGFLISQHFTVSVLSSIQQVAVLGNTTETFHSR